MPTAILNISCVDRRGLLAAITGFIFQNNGNIVSLDQFADPVSGQFFMRLEWDLTGFLIKRAQLVSAITKLTEELKICQTWELFFSDEKPKLAIFVSKYDHCLYDLLLRHRSGELNCQIELIISNHTALQYVAKAFGIQFKYIPVSQQKKEASEAKALSLLKRHKIDFVVLARYMQILSEKFIEVYPHKIINVHHSFLPAFSGAKPYQQAYERGVKIIGATAHFVTKDLDQGPIIAQQVENISHKDSVEDLMVQGRDLERLVLSEAVRLYIEHRLFVCNGRVITL